MWLKPKPSVWLAVTWSLRDTGLGNEEMAFSLRRCSPTPATDEPGWKKTSFCRITVDPNQLHKRVSFGTSQNNKLFTVYVHLHPNLIQSMSQWSLLQCEWDLRVWSLEVRETDTMNRHVALGKLNKIQPGVWLIMIKIVTVIAVTVVHWVENATKPHFTAV